MTNKKVLHPTPHPSVTSPMPEDVRCARIDAGLTLKTAAERFGYSLPGWQKKETSGAVVRRISIGEYELLLLLADRHPEYHLVAGAGKGALPE